MGKSKKAVRKSKDEQRQSEQIKQVEETARPTKAPREERNGVKRPKEGGVCAAVWAWLDKNGDHKLSDMKDVIAANGWNANNFSAERASWRRFNGIMRTATK